MPRLEDLDRLFEALIDKGVEDQERGTNYLKFAKDGDSYVVERIGDGVLVWKSNMLFREGCKHYDFDRSSMTGTELGETIWNDLMGS